VQKDPSGRSYVQKDPVLYVCKCIR
jgi:hypothetical protein